MGSLYPSSSRYVWFQKFDDAIKPTEQKYGIDGSAHLDKVNELMGKLGYKKGGDGMWVDASGRGVMAARISAETRSGWLRPTLAPPSRQTNGRRRRTC